MDSESELLLIKTLQELKDLGVTTIMITHKPSLLSGMDKVLVMKEGQMGYFGPREDIISNINPGTVDTTSNKSES